IAVGCATAPRQGPENYGPYPDNYETLVEEAVKARSSKFHSMTATVNSVTEPVKAGEDEIAGWLVRAEVRLAKPNRAGGIDLAERTCSFLIRNGRVISSDFAEAP